MIEKCLHQIYCRSVYAFLKKTYVVLEAPPKIRRLNLVHNFATYMTTDLLQMFKVKGSNVKVTA